MYLFSDAELPKNIPQNLGVGDGAGDGAEGVEGEAEVFGDEVGGEGGGKGGAGIPQGVGRVTEGFVVAEVGHEGLVFTRNEVFFEVEETIFQFGEAQSGFCGD